MIAWTSITYVALQSVYYRHSVVFHCSLAVQTSLAYVLNLKCFIKMHRQNRRTQLALAGQAYWGRKIAAKLTRAEVAQKCTRTSYQLIWASPFNGVIPWTDKWGFDINILHIPWLSHGGDHFVSRRTRNSDDTDSRKWSMSNAWVELWSWTLHTHLKGLSCDHLTYNHKS